MAEKFYETCAKQVATIIYQHKEDAKKVADAIQKLSTDRRYSDYGRKDLMEKLKDELSTLNQEKTNELKEVVQQFVNQYQVEIKEDKADPQEVANALKVIEMCGFGLTVDTLRAAIEPIKGSYSTLKMIQSMFNSKNQNSLTVEASYKYECLDLLNDYLGQVGTINDYEDFFAEVKSVLDMPMLVSAGIHSETDWNGSVINRLLDTTPYITLCLADNMMKVGKLYEQASLEYPGFFK